LNCPWKGSSMAEIRHEMISLRDLKPKAADGFFTGET